MNTTAQESPSVWLTEREEHDLAVARLVRACESVPASRVDAARTALIRMSAAISDDDRPFPRLVAPAAPLRS